MTYGLGTRSYNRSREARDMKKERAEMTKKFEAAPRQVIELPVACVCKKWPFPHIHGERNQP